MYSEESLPQIRLIEGEEGNVGRQGETRREWHDSVSSARHGLSVCVSLGPRSRSSPSPIICLPQKASLNCPVLWVPRSPWIAALHTLPYIITYNFTFCFFNSTVNWGRKEKKMPVIGHSWSSSFPFYSPMSVRGPCGWTRTDSESDGPVFEFQLSCFLDVCPRKLLNLTRPQFHHLKMWKILLPTP